MGMKQLFIFLSAVSFFILSTSLHALSQQAGDSPVMEMLDSKKESKKLEGGMFKIAKPFIKRTPMGAILDEITMMVICPLDLEGGKDGGHLAEEAKRVLKSYNLVQEIDDEMSTMTIYIDTPKEDKFSEIILYHTRPDPAIMLFVGNFTVDSLIRVGELSEQQRKHLKKNK